MNRQKRTGTTALVGVALTMLSVVGCGSTVPATVSGTGVPAIGTPGGTATGAVAPNASGQGPDSANLSLGTTSSGGTANGVTAPGSSGPATDGTPPPVTGDAAGVSGRGVDAKHIYIGVETVDANSTQGNVDADVTGVLDDINHHGGVFGRTLVERSHHSSTQSLYADPSTEAQAVCTQFTQDTPVAVVINTEPALDGNTFYHCLAAAKMPFITTGLRVIDRTLEAAFSPYYHAVSSPTWDWLIPALVTRLQVQDFFHSWDTSIGQPATATPVKIGLLYGNAPENTRTFTLLHRVLEQHGYRNITTFTYDMTSAEEGFATAGNAELQFRTAGVTHVFVDEGVLGVFGVTAQQQGYHPRYALQTVMYPQQTEAFMGKAQMTGALGIGWMPTEDEDHPQSTGSTQTRCLADIHTTGQNLRGNQPATQVALAVCDALRLATAAWTAGGGVTAAQFETGYVRAAPSFRSAVTFRSAASSSEPSLVGAVRDLGYVTSCGCLRYLSNSLTLE